MTDWDVIGIMCLLWFGVGWAWGRFGKDERERRKEERRFRRMIRK